MAVNEPRRPSIPINAADLRLAALLLGLCGYLYWETTRFEEVSDLFAQGIPPAFFPRLLIWTVGAFALVLPFEHLILAKAGTDIDAGRRQRIGVAVLSTTALLAAIVALIPAIGIPLAMIAVCLALPWLWGERRLKVLLPFAAVFPTLVTALFGGLLGIHFDPGLLPSLLGLG